MTWKYAWMIVFGGGTLVTAFTRVASVAPLPDVPARPFAESAGQTALTAEIARLHQRLQAPIVPMRSGRDLFAFRPAPRVEPRGDTRTLSAPVTTDVGAAVRSRSLRLVGLAEDAGPDGPVRTAIVSGPAGLQFARIGDLVGAGDAGEPAYRVTAILDAAVVLSLHEELPPLVLTLE
jgi:hypothetical protein